MNKTIEHKPRTDAEQKMWTYMTSVRKFTHKDVADATRVTYNARQRYFHHLKSAKFLRDLGWENGSKYFTVRGPQALADKAAEQRGTIEGKIWTVMRCEGSFTPDEVSMVLAPRNPEITPERVKKYISDLMPAGYLTVVERARSGVSPARYRLTRNTGPLPPSVKRKRVVVDANEESVVHVEGFSL